MSAVLAPTYPGSVALVNPKHEAFVQHYVATSGSRGQAAKLAGVTTTTARNLLQDVEATARIRYLNAQQFQSVGITAEKVKKELADIAFQSANDLFDDDGNLIPINALPDHVASTIVQVEVEIRDKIVKDDEGNPTVESVTVKKIKRADKMAGLTLLARYFKIVGAEDDGVNALATALADRLNAAKRRLDGSDLPMADEVHPPRPVIDSSMPEDARIIGEAQPILAEPPGDEFASPDQESDDEIW